MPYKFMYFNVRGRAQHIRYLLEDNALEYDETTICDFQEWFAKYKETTKFGALPVLHDDKVELSQSGAIMRHLARKHGLYGSNNEEASLIDMCHDQCVDFREGLLKLIFSKGDYEKDKKAFVDRLPSDMAQLEGLLKENAEGKGFFVGKKISFADYMAYDVLVNLVAFAPKCLDACPLLKGFVDRMSKRPNMVKFIKSEKFQKTKITINDRLL